MFWVSLERPFSLLQWDNELWKSAGDDWLTKDCD
jgi:hypothetical protein